MGLGAMMGMALLASVLVYAVFVASRAAVTALARVPGGTPPFGEAPLGRWSRRSLAARIALTLAGPLAVYFLSVSAWTVGIHRTGVMDEATAAIDVEPGGPADEAGLRGGDRIAAIDGQPLAGFNDIKAALAKRPGASLELLVERDGGALRLRVTPGLRGTPFAGRLGVTHRATPLVWSAALRVAALRPFEVMAAQARAAIGPQVRAELAGPIGITRAVGASPGLSFPGAFAVGVTKAGADALYELVLVALFLFPFRPREDGPPLAGDALPQSTSAPRPWVRFAARSVDQALLLVILMLTFAAIDPGLVELAVAASLLIAIPLEAVLLATWGYTPGKRLLRVAVRDFLGRKLSFGQALRRTAAVWTFGLAVNQPIGLVTLPLSFRRLRRSGATYWDAIDGARVDHDTVGGGRATIAVLIIAAFAVFQILVALRSFDR